MHKTIVKGEVLYIPYFIRPYYDILCKMWDCTSSQDGSRDNEIRIEGLDNYFIPGPEVSLSNLSHLLL